MCLRLPGIHLLQTARTCRDISRLLQKAATLDSIVAPRGAERLLEAPNDVARARPQLSATVSEGAGDPARMSVSPMLAG